MEGKVLGGVCEASRLLEPLKVAATMVAPSQPACSHDRCFGKFHSFAESGTIVTRSCERARPEVMRPESRALALTLVMYVPVPHVLARIAIGARISAAKALLSTVH